MLLNVSCDLCDCCLKPNACSNLEKQIEHSCFGIKSSCCTSIPQMVWNASSTGNSGSEPSSSREKMSISSRSMSPAEPVRQIRQIDSTLSIRMERTEKSGNPRNGTASLLLFE
uniref:(northern house mosquito) hypothetical protein n=1 Tax=Culex pipiens TaxID=7175 RepID=A0A8D8GTT5_CULPI